MQVLLYSELQALYHWLYPHTIHGELIPKIYKSISEYLKIKLKVNLVNRARASIQIKFAKPVVFPSKIFIAYLL